MRDKIPGSRFKVDAIAVLASFNAVSIPTRTVTAKLQVLPFVDTISNFEP